MRVVSWKEAVEGTVQPGADMLVVDRKCYVSVPYVLAKMGYSRTGDAYGEWTRGAQFLMRWPGSSLKDTLYVKYMDALVRLSRSSAYGPYKDAAAKLIKEIVAEVDAQASAGAAEKQHDEDLGPFLARSW